MKKHKLCKLDIQSIYNHRNVTYIFPFIIILLTIIEFYINITSSVFIIILAIIHICSVTCIPKYPKISSIITLSTFMICCFIPDNGGPSMIWGVWYALFFCGLYADAWYELIYPFAISACRIWRSYAIGMELSQYVLLLSSFFIAYFIGKETLWKQTTTHLKYDKILYEQARAILLNSQKEAAAATKIHDTATENLAYMAIVLDQAKTRHETLNEETINILYNRTIQTLREIRTAINVLNGDETILQEIKSTPIRRKLQLIATQGDIYLKDLGFSGETVIAKNITSHIKSEHEEEILSLLHELYTNIAVHAKPYGNYHILIRKSKSNIQFFQVNETSRQSLFPEKPSSKKGLSLHAATIQSFGGALHTSLEDDSWTLQACIPLGSTMDDTTTEEERDNQESQA